MTFAGTVKPVLSGHSKIDKIKILMTNCSSMKVESIVECLTCIKRLLVLKTIFLVFLRVTVLHRFYCKRKDSDFTRMQKVPIVSVKLRILKNNC